MDSSDYTKCARNPDILALVTCTMVPPVAIMGSDTSTLSSAAKDAGSLFRYHDACMQAVTHP